MNRKYFDRDMFKPFKKIKDSVYYRLVNEIQCDIYGKSVYNCAKCMR